MQLPTRILLLAASLASAAQAAAQTTGGATADSPREPLTLETVRVTADLWASPLDQIPASVSVFDAADLALQGHQHFGDLVNQIPNLTWTGGTSRPRYLQIRGIGENSQYEGETPDSAVRFLVDDLDFTGLGTVGSTFDVQQVEVLRGPQAGAFGANAAGGVVRVVTNAPTPFWSGRVEAGVAENGLRTGGFAIGGPLLSRRPEELMFRVAVQHYEDDGFRRNLTVDRHTNAREERSARLRLTWNPNALWQWETGWLISDTDNGFDEFALDNNGRYTYSDQPGRDEQESFAGSLRGTYRGWEEVRLTTITAGSWVESLYSYDDDWTIGSYEGFSEQQRDRDTFNQELRLDSVEGARAGWIDRWTFGAFYSRIDEDGTYTNTDPDNVRGLQTRFRTSNAALFGQAAHDFTPATRLVIGLRGEWVDLDGAGTRTRYRRPRDAYDPVVTVHPRFDDAMLGGKVTLEHQLSDRNQVFASITRGYKAGGINIDARIDPTSDPLTYETEYLWNYELGLRGRAVEDRLRGEIVGFYLQRRDTQVRDSAGFGGSYRFFTDNGRGAEVYGLEASANYDWTERVTLHGSVAWMESELDPFVLANGNIGGGRRLANTPRWGYSVGARYRDPTGWFGAIDWTGRARHYDSNNHDEERRSFDVVNASLGYNWRNWTATVWVRNAFDVRYDKRVFFFGNEPPDWEASRYESRADPRQIGVTLAYTF